MIYQNGVLCLFLLIRFELAVVVSSCYLPRCIPGDTSSDKENDTELAQRVNLLMLSWEQNS
jgi:hypothetical protein